MVYIILIDLKFNICMCFLFSTYYIILLQYDYILCMVNDIIFLLLTVKFPFVCGIVPTVLSRPNFSMLRNKVYQYLAFVWLIPGAMYDTYRFGYIIHMIYISFSALVLSLTHIVVSIWQCGFSSHFIAVNITVGVCPSRYFIIRLYYTFVNIFWCLHVFKHVYNLFLSNIFTIKPLNILPIDPAVGHISPSQKECHLSLPQVTQPSTH